MVLSSQLDGLTIPASGPAEFDLGTQAFAVLQGVDSASHTGWAVDLVESVDGDDRAEVLVGAPRFGVTTGVDNRGAAFMVPGSAFDGLSPGTEILLPGPRAWSFYGADDGSNKGEHAGYSIAAGRVDDDAFDDIVIAAPGYNDLLDNGRETPGQGRVHVVYATDFAGLPLGATIDLANASHSLIGEVQEDTLGSGVAAVDLDGDGQREVVMGAGWARSPNDTLNRTGQVYIYGPDELTAAGSDATASETAAKAVVWAPETATGGDLMGYRVGGAGDVNGDGLEDLVVTSPQNDDLGGSCGKLYLVLSPY